MEKQEPSTLEKKAVNTMYQKGKRFTLGTELDQDQHNQVLAIHAREHDKEDHHQESPVRISRFHVVPGLSYP